MYRRDFLKCASLGMTALGLSAWSGCRPRPSAPPAFGGQILGASLGIGHRLMQNQLPPPTAERKVPVLIIGAGISGLSAGWRLQKGGLKDFEILELEPLPGGVSQSGENQVSAYPWGAHYVPLPTKESRAVRLLFEELGIITGYTPAGSPIYDERYLCFAPQERLFIHGKWQEGFLPLVGATRKDLEQYERFREIVHSFRVRRDAQGRKPFAIPLDMSSRDADLLVLDRITFREYLLRQKLDSIPLHWYANYATRDDYGTSHGETSAWAGLHYFCSRDGQGEGADDEAVVTWPEGNAWIVKRLAERLHPQLTTNALAYRMENQGKQVLVDVYLPRENRCIRYRAGAVIYAAPRAFARFLESEADPKGFLRKFEYAPWMVANLTLRSLPPEQSGFPLCWDNVIYNSPSLGYVVANHQTLRTQVEKTVFTFYYALAHGPWEQERAKLLGTDWRGWADFILGDLSRPYPGLGSLIERLDVFRWGHAMIRPRPGLIWGEARRLASRPRGRVYFAHSDLSGISLFEEAQYRGILAAETVLAQFRIGYQSFV